MPKVPKDKVGERPVLYPELQVRIYRDTEGSNLLSAAEAMEILGWKGVTGQDYDFVDRNGAKVCVQAAAQRQRPFYPTLARQWMCEILGRPGQGINPETELGGNWQLTGETIVIGRTGLNIEGRHRLVGLVWAAQEWAKDPSQFPSWPTEPTINALVVLGVSESQAVVNVMNTGKPRSLADAAIAAGLFDDQPRQDAKKLSRILDYGVRLLWHRTGAGLDAYAPRRSHAESMDFITRHPKLLECVSHIYEEDGEEKRITKFIPPGHAAGLLYLMGSGATDPEKYTGADTPTEDLLQWRLWDQACKFWVLLAQGNDQLMPVKTALQRMLEAGNASTPGRTALLAKAWGCLVAKKNVTAKTLRLHYETGADDEPILAECPTVGGVDLGDPKAVEAAVDASAEPPKGDPTPAEIAERAAEVRTPKLKPKRAGKEWAKGDIAWVRDEDGPFLGTLVDAPYPVDGDKPHVDIQTPGSRTPGSRALGTPDSDVWTVAVADLFLKKPAV